MNKFPYPLRFYNQNKKQIEYIKTGKGKTFVILPGGGETAQCNFSFIRSLERSYKVIVPTLYDFDSIQEVHTVINGILDHENVNQIILYGLSVGGILAQTYAKAYPHRVKTLIISHACTPYSSTYKKRIIIPLKLVRVFLPLFPNSFIKFANNFAMKIQGNNNDIKLKYPLHFTKQDQKYWKTIMDHYYEYFFNKRLIQTWIHIHLSFSKQTLNPKDFSYLRKNILILKTDNDPLMQDEGDFKRVYPNAIVHTFKDTGHLTSYYQQDAIIEVIKSFLPH